MPALSKLLIPDVFHAIPASRIVPETWDDWFWTPVTEKNDWPVYGLDASLVLLTSFLDGAMAVFEDDPKEYKKVSKWVSKVYDDLPMTDYKLYVDLTQ